MSPVGGPSDHGAIQRPSKKGPGVLNRNAACHQCRKRKLKCNGCRPLCSNCAKPRVQRARRKDPIDNVRCTWDEFTEGVAAPAEPNRVETARRDPKLGKRTRLEELEEKLAKYESLLDVQGGSYPPSFLDLEGTSSNRDPGYLSVTASDPSRAEYWGNDRSSWIVAAENALEASSELPPLFGRSMIKSDWPQELPSIETVEHIVNLFFEKVATWPQMIRKSAFKRNLHLPPNHPKFPALPLLHAIVCLTSSHFPPTALSDGRYWPICTPMSATSHPELGGGSRIPESRLDFSGIGLSTRSSRGSSASTSALVTFQLWHKRHALEAIRTYIDAGKQFTQILQAVILLAAHDQLNAQFADMWMHTGAAMHMAIPIRIYESSVVPPSILAGFGERFRAKASDPVEQAEMDRTWWMVYLLERGVSVWTNRPVALADDEITCELPVLKSTFERGDPYPGPPMRGIQTVNDIDLFTVLPECHADPLVLHIKSVKLFVDTHKFFRMYERRPHSVGRYAAEPGVISLIHQVYSLRASVPLRMQRPTESMVGGGRIDRDLLLAEMFMQSNLVVLGNPIVTADTISMDLVQTALAAVRSIMALLYDIISTRYDITLLPASFAYIMLLTAKCIAKFLTLANERGDVMNAAIYRSEIVVLQQVLHTYGERFPLGELYAKRVDNLLAEYDGAARVLCADANTAFRLDDLIPPELGVDQLFGAGGSLGELDFLHHGVGNGLAA